jgi:hypothetical protein
MELVLRLHLLAAAAVALITALGLWPARSHRARTLRIDPDGSVWLQWHAGTWEAVQLSPASLYLGGCVLLVLRGNRRVLRLLLGPDNLAPRDLAALRRRLRAAPGGGASALHSAAAPGRHSSTFP